jgi:hypothetical protein
MGIFSPSSSLTTTITGFSGLGVTQAACINTVNNQILAIYVSNTVGYPVNVTDINVSGNNGVNTVQNVNSLLRAGQSGVFYVNGACNGSTSSYSGSVAIKYTEPSQILPGPFFSNGKISSVISSHNSNYVAKFNGSGNYISIPSGVYFSGNAFTITGWVYLKNYNKWERLLDFGNGHPSNNVLFALSQGISGQPLLQYFNGSIGTPESGSTQLPLNSWIFIVGVYNGSGLLIYENTVFAGYNPTNGLTLPRIVRTSNYIGRSNWYSLGDQDFNGSMANIQIYSTLLSKFEIQTMYQEGMGNVPVSNTGLVSWWPLDGNANDYSGNNNNGIATGIQWASP